LIRLRLAFKDKLANRRNGGLAMIQNFGDETWRPIAEQVITEMNPKKLAILLVQLCHALDEREELEQHRRNQAKAFHDLN
jgi:hypothetical protein